MRHRQKILILAFALFLMAIIVVMAFVAVAPIIHAQTPSNSIEIIPVDASGSVFATGTATWYADEPSQVVIGGLQGSDVSNQLFGLYLADPVTLATSSLLLEATPTANATDTYLVSSTQLSNVPQGTYRLLLMYSFTDSQPENYTVVSSASVLVLPSPQSSPTSTSNPSSSSSCASGFVYDPSSLNHCVVIGSESYGASYNSSCQSSYSYNGTQACIPSSSQVSNPTSPTVDLNPNSTAGTAAPAATNNGITPVSAPSLAICTGVADGSGRPICDFNELLIEGRTIIDWLFAVAVPIAVVLFAYGGLLYITGTSGNRTKANGIFTAAGIGFGIMLIAWVSVYTIVGWLTAGTNSNSANPTGITSFLGQ